MSRAQLGLFAGAKAEKPAAAFEAHETIQVGDVVRVRLRLSGESHEEQLPRGPLTYAECSVWEDPCKLYSCRHRLPDEVERKTRQVIESEDEPAWGSVDLEDEEYEGPDPLEGPRMVTRAYYSASPLMPGHWCALQVAELYPGPEGVTLEELGRWFGVTREGMNKEVHRALRAFEDEDIELDDIGFEHYGDRGRVHKFKFTPPDDNLTSTEVKALVVPGEERCACETPIGQNGKPCATCGRKIPGRQALRVNGKRRPRNDRWAGVVRVIPEEFKSRVNERLLNQSRANDTIPDQFRDIGKMLAARRARDAA